MMVFRPTNVSRTQSINNASTMRCGVRAASWKSSRARPQFFPRQVIELLTGALQLRDCFNEENADQDLRGYAYEDYVQQLCHLTERPRLNEANERFAKHLYNHAAWWFMFLVFPTIPATNHRAEQALKTPIVNRKVWGGNRADPGGKAQSVTSAVLQTCQNKAVDVF